MNISQFKKQKKIGKNGEINVNQEIKMKNSFDIANRRNIK